MPVLVALDVAILPPPDVTRLAMAISAELRADEADGWQLDAEHLPHITLTQQFVRAEELETAYEHVDEALRGQAPLRVQVTGGGKSGGSVWMVIHRTPALIELHGRLMEALRGVERPEGGPGAFYDSDARVGDVLWVAGFRLKSSFGAFTPHVTLGRAAEPPVIEPLGFDAHTVAACHLGRFCTCRRVLRSWQLGR